MGRKRILVDVDENQWAALRGQAEMEGRFVRVLLAEAIGADLERGGLKAKPHAVVPPPSATRTPTVEEVRALMERVQPESARERAQRMAARQAYLRDHPEEEQQ